MEKKREEGTGSTEWCMRRSSTHSPVGVKSGTLFRGTLNVSNYNPDEATIRGKFSSSLLLLSLSPSLNLLFSFLLLSSPVPIFLPLYSFLTFLPPSGRSAPFGARNLHSRQTTAQPCCRRRCGGSTTVTRVTVVTSSLHLTQSYR